MLQVIGIGEIGISKDVDDVLITYSLGSCIGIAAYDPVSAIGGIVHTMLPLSKMDLEKAKKNPAMYTDTGTIHLLDSMTRHGAKMKNLIIKIAGGGAPLETGGNFRIGERNYAVLRKILWKNNLLINAEDVGGTKPRTLSLKVRNGETTIKSAKEVTIL